MVARAAFFKLLMSKPPLFREEAREGLKVRLEGEVVAYTPPSIRRLAIALAIAAVAAGVFASTATYTRYASATGVIAPRAGLITVTAPFKGDIVSISAKLGDVVSSGQTLALLRQNQVQADGKISLEKERQLLQTRKESNDLLLRAKQVELDRSVGASQARVEGTRRALEAAKTVLESTRSQAEASKRYLDQQRKLIDSGFLASSGATTAERAYLGDMQAVRQAEQSVASQQLELTNAEQAVAQAQSQRASLLAQSADTSASLDLEASRLSSANEAMVTSTVAGTIAAAPVMPGPVSPGSALFIVSPKGALYAHLVLPEQAAYKAKKGQQVVLRLVTASREETTRLTGTLEELSSAPIPTGSGERADQGYLAFVRLDEASQKTHFPLGARVEARLQVETKSLLGWLFDPLIRGLRQTSFWF